MPDFSWREAIGSLLSLLFLSKSKVYLTFHGGREAAELVLFLSFFKHACMTIYI